MSDTLVTNVVPGEPESSPSPQTEAPSTTNVTTTDFTPKVTGQSDSRVYTQEDIEKARQQEKDKLYKRLETLNETVSRLEAESRSKAESAEAEQRRLQNEATQKAEDEMSAKDLLAKREQEWQMQLAAVQEQVEEQRALRERETQYAQLMDFRQHVVQQYSDRVAPELLDLIDGETPEQMQASAEDMAERTQRILAQTAEAMQTARQQTPTVRATAPASGENSGSQRSFSPEEIRGMSMADYAKHRRSLLGGGTDGPTSRGLFG